MPTANAIRVLRVREIAIAVLPCKFEVPEELAPGAGLRRLAHTTGPRDLVLWVNRTSELIRAVAEALAAPGTAKRDRAYPGPFDHRAFAPQSATADDSHPLSLALCPRHTHPA